MRSKGQVQTVQRLITMWVTWWERNKLFLTAVLFITLTSLAYFSPFPSAFRFGLGVVVLAAVLLYFERLPALLLTVVSGTLIVGLRLFFLWLVNDEPMSAALGMAGPALMFYIAYGCGFVLLRPRRTRHLLLVTLCKLFVLDVVSNIIEISLRPSILVIPTETVYSSLAAIAFIRSALAAAGCYSLRKYHAVILAGEKMARYTEMVFMVAKLKAELFYLQKSSQDIEQVMARSFSLYRYLQEHRDAAAEESLWVARNIHEIKKDYQRVISGIEEILQPQARTDQIALSEIFFILEQNTARTLRAAHKDIQLCFTRDIDFVTDKQYMLVSILNNLIVNAIEAIAQRGEITVHAAVEREWCVFQVCDTGCGMDMNTYPLIFKAGYSTKFSPATGKMSTGLGLAHVKNLTAALEGEVSCTSQRGMGTCFTVRIPCAVLRAGKGTPQKEENRQDGGNAVI